VLPLSEIKCRPQVRETIDAASVDRLARAIGQVGLLQPILVSRAEQSWILIEGYRRYLAAQMSGWSTIPALIEEDSLSEGDVVQRQLVCNLHREDLSPIETARGIDRLMKEATCTAAAASIKVGLSASMVSKTLALLILPKETQDLVHCGQLAASTAYEIAKTADPKRRAELIAMASQGRLKRDVAAGRNSPSVKTTRKAAPRSAGGSSRGRIVIPAGGGRSLSAVGMHDLADLLAMLEQVIARLRTLSTRPGIDLAGALAALASEDQREEESDVRQAR
jgi:ParB family chromosome partitioning protein